MHFELPALPRDEEIALRLRALFEKSDYRLYRMGSFEEYDLYMQNKAFLTDDDIITFTGANGRLMALKPDVTLSIVKSTPAGQQRKVYYTESVFRRSRQTGEYREINQMGLEYIGGVGTKAEAEVLMLAAQSLAVAGSATLDLSHMEFIEEMLAPLGGGQQRLAALAALRCKSPHGMRDAVFAAGGSDKLADKLAKMAELSGVFEEALEEALELAKGVSGAMHALDELRQLGGMLKGCKATIRLDFSILNDIDYYNGLIFQGYVNGVAQPVLSGGRYDSLLQRFNKQQGALGFALYLDFLGRTEEESSAKENEWLNVALPKGRMGEKVYTMFANAGFSCQGVLGESRKLVFEDLQNHVRYFLVKPSDVDIYVEHGAADIGVVGKDVLLESGADVLELLDLKLGACKLAVAAMAGFAENPALPLRVASKYPAVARSYYAAQSRTVEIIKLHGSIELAPLLGLSDVIVDIVESGATLKENNLEVLADVVPSSARLIANRAAWRFKGNIIKTLVERLSKEL